MTDLVKRLREDGRNGHNPLCLEAADRIEALEAENALCDMILKYEQPPVDRKLLCAREAVTSANMNELDWGEITASAACLRAIELWEEGYGE